MMSVRLHEQPAHPDGVGADLERLLDHLGERHLDAEVVHLVAVVREDDVDEVLADVVDVALHGGEHDPALRVAALDAAPSAARGGRRPPSSSRPTAARTAAASGRSRTARRRPSCRRGAGR